MTIMLKTARIRDDDNLLIPILEINQHEYSPVKSIQTSPYTENSHWLQLNRESLNYQIVALALQSFTPTTKSYAFEKYHRSFNIEQIIDIIQKYVVGLNYQFPSTTVYIIAFRSILYEEVRNSSDKRQFLAQVDKASHLEANESGGLLKYWFGIPDDIHGQNLATCWWISKQHAKAGGGGKAHREGMKTVRTWFQHWQVEEYELTIKKKVESYTFTRIE